MLWDKLNKLTNEEFKRKVGYYREVVLKMIEVVENYKTKARLKDKRGNKSNFSSSDEVDEPFPRRETFRPPHYVVLFTCDFTYKIEVFYRQIINFSEDKHCQNKGLITCKMKWF